MSAMGGNRTLAYQGRSLILGWTVSGDKHHIVRIFDQFVSFRQLVEVWITGLDRIENWGEQIRRAITLYQLYSGPCSDAFDHTENLFHLDEITFVVDMSDAYEECRTD